MQSVIDGGKIKKIGKEVEMTDPKLVKSVTLYKGKESLHLQKIRKASGNYFYTAKKKGSKRQILFDNINDIKSHYKSWDGINKIA